MCDKSSRTDTELQNSHWLRGKGTDNGLKEIGVILMLAGAGVKLLTDSAPKIAHMLGF